MLTGFDIDFSHGLSQPLGFSPASLTHSLSHTMYLSRQPKVKIYNFKLEESASVHESLKKRTKLPATGSFNRFAVS
jgi:hypothetical protein